MKQCAGWPAGHVCPVIVKDDRTLCQGCLLDRQEAIASGIPDSGMLPVGTVLEDFEVPKLVCSCEGDPTMPHHNDSLRHMQWAWAQKQESADVQSSGRPLAARRRG